MLSFFRISVQVVRDKFNNDEIKSLFSEISIAAATRQ